MGKHVPARWRDYTNIGCVVKGSRFLCFKVPLKPAILSKLPKEEHWSIPDLIQVENLGLVVDLTHTDRYYDKQSIIESGLRYVKIKTMGHIIPSKNVVDQFYKAVDVFMKEDKERFIGVHCTHGLNRTGYLVCRYMIEKLGIDPEEAIQEFNNARGHQQERLNYISHLKLKGWEPNTTWKEEIPKEGKKGRPTDSNEGINSRWQNGEQPKSKRRSPDEYRRGFDRSTEQQPGPYQNNQFCQNPNDQFCSSWNKQRGNHQANPVEYQQGYQSDRYHEDYQFDQSQRYYQRNHPNPFEQDNHSGYQQDYRYNQHQQHPSEPYQGGGGNDQQRGFHQQKHSGPYQGGVWDDQQRGFQQQHPSGPYQGGVWDDQQRGFQQQKRSGPYQRGVWDDQQRGFQQQHSSGPYQEGVSVWDDQQRGFQQQHTRGPYKGGSRRGYDQQREGEDFTSDGTVGKPNLKEEKKGFFFNFGADLERETKQREEKSRRGKGRGSSRYRGGLNQRFNKNPWDESSGRYQRKDIALDSLKLQDTLPTTSSTDSTPKKNPMEKLQQDSSNESNPEKNTHIENDPQQKPSIIDDKAEKNIPIDNHTKEEN